MDSNGETVSETYCHILYPIPKTLFYDVNMARQLNMLTMDAKKEERRSDV